MNRLKIFILLAAMVAGSGILRAQSSEVAVLENDGRFALFSVQTSAAEEDGVSTVALRTLFRTLLENGVEGFLNGSPLEQNPNSRWKDNFLKVKNPPYMLYVKGYQTEGEPIKNNVGAYQATVLVRVNVEFLIRQLKNSGVMKK